MPLPQKYALVFPTHVPAMLGLRPLVELLRASLPSSPTPIVAHLSEVPSDTRPILFGAHFPAVREEWGPVRDDAIVYETEQHAWWFPDTYRAWLSERSAVWSVFKTVVPRAIYVPTGYSQLFDVPWLHGAQGTPWIDVLHYGAFSPHREQVLREVSRIGLNVVSVNQTFDEALSKLLGDAKCVVSINFGGEGDGQRLAVLRCVVPMCRGIATLAELTPDTRDAGWTPVVSSAEDFAQSAQQVVQNYKGYGQLCREVIQRCPYEETVRRALAES